MTPTPEEIEQLRISGETLSAIAANAARVDELEATLDACRDDLMNVSQTAADRHALIQRLNLAVSEQALRAGDAQRGKAYAEEQLTHLAKFIGLHGMTWAHVVSEAVSLIERQKKEADTLFDHRKQSAELIGKLIHENNSLRGPVPPIGSGEFPAPPSPMVSLSDIIKAKAGYDYEAMTAEIEQLRAENGRQAATIALARVALNQLACLGNGSVVGNSVGNQLATKAMDAIDQAGAASPTRVRIETPHTGRDDKALFRDWMESSAQPFASLEAYAAALVPLRLEVGKTYVRRDGGLEEINFHDDHGTFFPSAPFKASSGKLYYADGLCRPGHWSHADLVAEATTS